MNLRDLGSADEALKWAAYPFTRIHFSQFGEDVLIWSLLQCYRMLDHKGFYVDFGAHHPTYMSNTHMLTLMGWRGLNVDANVDVINLFHGMRPDDINVVAAISDVERDIEFNIYNNPGVSTADPEMMAQHAKGDDFKIVRVDKMRTTRMDQLLDQYVPEGQTIDFLTVDLEGFDYDALNSNNWDKYAPFFIAVEDHKCTLRRDRPASPIYDLLTSKGYRLACQAFVTSIYVRDLD